MDANDEDISTFTFRVISNCSKLNEYTKKNITVLPQTESIRNKLQQGRRYSILDITDYFSSIRCSEEYAKVFGLVMPFGCYKPKTLLQGAVNSPHTGQTISNWGLIHTIIEKNGQPLTDAVAMIDDFGHIIYPQDSVSEELRLINYLIKQQLENFTNSGGKDKPLKISPYKMKIGVQTVEYLNKIFHKVQTTNDPSNY